MKEKFALILLFVALNFISARAQNVVTADNLDDFLNRAEKASAIYSETFKNLSADETKVFEDFDKTGNLKETRRINSIFIVYQSLSGVTGELRNVTEFNDKSVARQNDEIAAFFEKISKSETVTEEIIRLKNDGNRFDGRTSAWGMTLWQESPFKEIRPFFEFKIVGVEQIENRQAIIIEYRQMKPTALIKFNPTKEDWIKEPNGRQYAAAVSSKMRPYNPLISGKIRLDAETAQIWRNEFKVTIQPARFSKPITALELSYEYQPSGFGILVPKKFTIISNKISGANDDNLSVTKDRTMTFEYSKFSEFNSDVMKYKINLKQ